MSHVKNGFWKTKEGTRIALADMEDSHLMNSMAMVKRRKEVIENMIIECDATIFCLDRERVRRLNAKKAAAKKPKPVVVKEIVAPVDYGNKRKFRES